MTTDPRTTLPRMLASEYVGHAPVVSWMVTIAGCLVLRSGSDRVFGGQWLCTRICTRTRCH